MFRPTPTLSGYIEGEALYLASAGRRARSPSSACGAASASRPARALFVVEPGQQRRPGPAGRGRARRRARPGRGRAQGPAPGRARHPRSRARRRGGRRARGADRCSTAPRRWCGAASTPASAWTRRAPPIETAAARLAGRATGGSRPRRSAQREDQIRAADARVARPGAARRDRRAARRHGAGRAAARPGRGGLLPARRMGGGQPADRRPDPGRSRSIVRFFVPEQAVAAYRPGARVRFRCDGCPDGLGATISYVSPRPEFTPPIIYSREARDRLVFMVEARPENGARLVPGLPVDVYPVGGAADDRRDRRRGPQQVLRRPARGQGLLDPGRAGPDHRLSRPQRLGQDHHPAHALRPAHAGQRQRHGARLRHHLRELGDQAAHRLHDPALLALRGPDGRGESPVQRPHPRPRPDARAGRRGARAARPRRAAAAAGGHPLGRLEAAAGAGGGDPARAAAAAARRADRGRRPAGAARPSGTRSTRSPPRA